jgi:phage protein D
MSFVAIPSIAADFGDFYVPRFEIRIADADLPGEVLRDVTQLTYHDNLQEIDGFELTVNNWNEATQNFKYLGIGIEDGIGDDPQQIFDPCNRRITVSFGYGDDVQPIVTGNFTSIEPHFPESGPSTLAVRGLNVLHRLRRKQYTTAWDNRTDSQIATNLATLTDPQTGQRRFPLPIATNPPRTEPSIPFVSQRNQYDIDFLFRRARERGYVVYVRANAQRPAEDELYFGPSDRQTAGSPEVGYELAWRQSLLEFTPTLTTANQVKSVTVNGWNRTTRQPISRTVTIDDPEMNINRDLRQILGACDPRDEVVVDEPMFTPDQAKARAQSILMDRLRTTIKATGRCIGLPGLRAGTRVFIKDVGTTFSGVYFLTSTTHTINDGGYQVTFEARRENPGGGAS